MTIFRSNSNYRIDENNIIVQKLQGTVLLWNVLFYEKELSKLCIDHNGGWLVSQIETTVSLKVENNDTVDENNIITNLQQQVDQGRLLR